MPRDLRPVNPTPLSESEEFQLKRLLDRRSQSLPEAQAQRDRERVEEARLRARQDKLAAEEARLARRLAQLHVDLDVVSSKLYQLAPSGIAFRTVNEQLKKLAELAPTQSFFNSRFDSLDQDQLMLLAEIGLAIFEMNTTPKGGKSSLRERMQSVKVDVGLDPADVPGPSDSRAALAAAIVRAGRRRRGEEV
jgi:hypothetical protein